MIEASSLAIGGIAGNVSSSTANASQSLNQTYDNFLKMLVTQLKNQDPLNPMDSKDFTSQLIQMSTAEQAIAQTKRSEEILKMMQASTVNTALNYIGLSVDYAGNNVSYDGKVPIDFSYELPEAAKDVQINVLNAEGNVVYTAKGEMGIGSHKYNWDGKDRDGNPAKPGMYRIEVGATNADNKALDTKVVVPGTVAGVETADGQVYLVINGEAVSIDTVRSAYGISTYYPPTTTTGNGTGTGTGTGETGTETGSNNNNETQSS